MNTGVFTISLDFELHWGVFDKKERLNRKACYINTLQLIPELLQLFSEYDVHVTWATVGSLFAKDENEWAEMKPAIMPSYSNPEFSPYKWAEKNKLSREFDWAQFAPEAIEQIVQYPGQELGTHTFGHYYCMEPGQTVEAFSADLDAAIEAANKINQPTRSLVFPRNQFNPEVLGICYRKGIMAVRSNPDSWFWTPVPDGGTHLLTKVFRTGDSYIKLGKRTSYPIKEIKVVKDQPLQLPASRFLRSWNPGYRLTNKIRLQRILSELKTAAIKNECYHLWWHPENFGDYPQQNMEDLKIILEAHQLYRSKYGMTSWNMGEYVTALMN